MELGYITFSSAEQQLVHNAIQQISQGAIDELGLGRIRDAFSDLMFPGMSTLQHKSKYFVLLPALYNQLSRENITDKNEINSRIIDWEINMTIGLLKYAEENGISKEGIIGNHLTIEDLIARKKDYVKNRPTHIYLSALRTYGLVKGEGGLTNLIYEQARNNAGVSNIHRTNQRTGDDPDATDVSIGVKPFFYPFKGYDFSNCDSSISLKLTKEEADILRYKIISKGDNLFSYLLKHDEVIIKEDFFEMADSINAFPEEYNYLKEVYALASDFSKWAHLMNTYYRYAFYSKMNPDYAQAKVNKDNQKAHIEDILKKKEYPPKDRLAKILEFISPIISPNSSAEDPLKKFCKEASDFLENNEEDKLINLIIKREQTIKGNRYKIGNARYKNTDFSGKPGSYAYRWNEIVYTLITDIRNPEQ